MSQRDDSHGRREPEWLHKHAHEPNPGPPSDDASFTVTMPGGNERIITVEDLAALPQSTVPECYIVSTGHGTSGPFTFSGVRLDDFVESIVPAGVAWRELYVISADGFGNRVFTDELAEDRLFLLATHVDGKPLSRDAGLVRLIVPSETDDALRQVKWISRIEVRA